MNELPRATVVTITRLCIVQPDGNALLRDASLDLKRGEIVLLVGPVGSGKSTLLRILAGLLPNGKAGWQISGQLTTNGRTLNLAYESCRAGAMVFQEHGLFDDLTSRENLDIAASHAGSQSIIAEALARALTAEIPPDRAVTLSSGGQKQLVAIARTLLANPAVLLFDEPNSGLDAGKVVRLAGALDTIRREVQCPLLITAHHVQYLLPIADKVIFLDPHDKSLICLDINIDSIEEKLRNSSEDTDLTGQEPFGQIARQVATEAIQRRSKLFWFGRFFREYMWALCLSPAALLYMALGGLLVGFVSTWFTLRHFPLSRYLTPLFHQELLAGIGFVQFRVLVPLIVSILLAAEERTHNVSGLHANSAGISVRWTKRHLEVRILSAQASSSGEPWRAPRRAGTGAMALRPTAWLGWEDSNSQKTIRRTAINLECAEMKVEWAMSRSALCRVVQQNMQAAYTTPVVASRPSAIRATFMSILRSVMHGHQGISSAIAKHRARLLRGLGQRIAGDDLQESVCGRIEKAGPRLC